MTVQSNEPIAATKIDSGTDVNFGALTRMLIDHLKNQNVEVNYKHSVQSIKRTKRWFMGSKSTHNDDGKVEYHTAKFVFLGAGGGSLTYYKNQVFLKGNILVDSLLVDYS